MTDFTAKKVLVLGGSRGIGAAIVRRFAGDGANVALPMPGRRMPPRRSPPMSAPVPSGPTRPIAKR
ncbi:Nucleoside-diphosphate-sugar epimerase OS=Sphingobium scionense OX=1404341 GN=GGQ90_001627 PE=4 SV=1 [Sphingobium scionense]|uniref:Nucleoside-diphosphate-sugar epimerase n=1 Tax=Sphingobium scionense TaxID=1404341 RepID=A0A7W6LNY6_9SPHN|nr:nucleoside-diphosphate-sugar epimerase [Sphingobium scionense]